MGYHWYIRFPKVNKSKLWHWKSVVRMITDTEKFIVIDDLDQIETVLGFLPDRSLKPYALMVTRNLNANLFPM